MLKHLVLFLVLSFVPASAAGKPPPLSPAKSSESKSWEYCYELSRKLGDDPHAERSLRTLHDAPGTDAQLRMRIESLVAL